MRWIEGTEIESLYYSSDRDVVVQIAMSIARQMRLDKPIEADYQFLKHE